MIDFYDGPPIKPQLTSTTHSLGIARARHVAGALPVLFQLGVERVAAEAPGEGGGWGGGGSPGKKQTHVNPFPTLENDRTAV